MGGVDELAVEVNSLDRQYSHVAKIHVGFVQMKLFTFGETATAPVSMPCEQLCVRMHPGWSPEAHCFFSLYGVAHLLPQVALLLLLLLTPQACRSVMAGSRKLLFGN